MQQDIKRVFVQGAMDKDLDNRLLPNGKVRHFVNMRVRSSEGSDFGSGKNVLGNSKITDLQLTNAETIGVFGDQINQKIYWFVTSDDKDLVLEHDKANAKTDVLLESSRPGILNFSKSYLITGVNKVYNGDSDKDLLEWTDDFNEPRRINIVRAKTYGADGFIEADISAIKAMPKQAPGALLTYTGTATENNMEERLLQFAYRYQYLDNEFSAISPFQYAAFASNRFQMNYQTMENEGMVNAFNAVDITFNTGSENVKAIQLLVKENNSPTVYVIDTFDKGQLLWANNTIESFTFSNNKVLVALPSAEYFKLYDNVPRLAKALENIGNRTVYGNILEGYDIIDQNGNAINLDYEVTLNSQSLIGEEITSSFTNTNWTGDTLSFDLLGQPLTKGHALQFDIYVESPTTFGSYNQDFTYVLNQDYADATELAAEQKFIDFFEKIITSSFMAGFTATPPPNGSVSSNTKFTISGATVNEISVTSPKVTYEINPPGGVFEDHTWSYVESSTAVFYNASGVNSSLKSNRDYEIGFIYRDDPGRATTALTSPYNTLHIPQSASIFKNKIQVQINHPPPAFADRYQLVIKTNKGNYETIYCTTFYTDGLFRWVKLEGASKDKVKEGDTLIVKGDLSGPVQDVVKTRVIEVTTQEEDFITDNKDENDNLIIEEPGVYMKIRPLGFNMNDSDSLYEFYDDFDSRHDNPNPTLNIGDFGFTDDQDVFEFYPITAGTKITIKIESWERNRNDNYWGYEESFIANQDHANFQAWFDTEVQNFGQFETDHLELVEFTDGGKNFKIRSNEGGYGWGGDRRILGEITVIFGNLLIFETEPLESDVDIFYETAETFFIQNGQHQGNIQNQDVNGFVPAIVEIDAFNCFAMGNGAESNKIKDALNQNSTNFDYRATSTSVEPYGAVRRFSDLTYSDPYQEESSENGLGSFNLSRANFKADISQKYGSIQKLWARDTDLIVYQEDKIHRVLFGKDLLMNADGSSNLTATDQVLGQHIAFAGEYGISKNPESHAVFGTRAYNADAKRGTYLRLSIDGITPISQYGLNNEHNKVFRSSLYKKKVGGFDPYNNEYITSQNDTDIFVPVTGISCSDSFSRSGFTGQQVIEINYGQAVGQGGFNFTSDKPLTYTFSWNGVLQSSGTSTVVNSTFNKTLANPTKGILTISTNEDNTDYSVSGVCVLGPAMTVITLVVNDVGDTNKTIKNRYRYTIGGVTSQYKTFNTIFESDGVSLYDAVSGIEGTGEIPKQGSTILIESYQGFADTGSFEPGDRLGYLLTDTFYDDSQSQDIIDNALFLIPQKTTYPSGDISNATSFILDRPSNEQYLYLVYDYVKKNKAPVAMDDTFSIIKGQAVIIDVLANDFDFEGGPLTVSIVAQPAHGSAVVNPDQTVTYTHDDSDNLSDVFTYKANDGELDSNIATVSAFVGTDCSEGLVASGVVGIYEATIVLGTDTGNAGISYDASGIPDRFQLSYDGQIVADSKFVGDSLSGTPPSYPGLVATHNLPVFEWTGTVFIATGETRTINVTQNQVANGTTEPTASTGAITFNKQFSEPTVMRLTVTAPVVGTAWSISGICPTPKPPGPGEEGTAFNLSTSSHDPGIGSNGEGACSLAIDLVKYHNGESLYPTLNDYVYNDLTISSPFNGQGHFYHIQGGRSIRIESNGRITDVWICGAGNA